MFYLYDEWIINRLREWVGDKKITVTGVDETNQLFSVVADQNKDKITLPLITLSRNGNISLKEPHKQPKTVSGAVMAKDIDAMKAEVLRATPATMHYQLDIYTRTRQQNDNLVREFIFSLMMFPHYEIEIPYNNSKRTHGFNLSLSNDLVDNSNIHDHFVTGEKFRTTINLFVDDAYLFNYKTVGGFTLDVETKIGDYDDR